METTEIKFVQAILDKNNDTVASLLKDKDIKKWIDNHILILNLHNFDQIKHQGMVYGTPSFFAIKYSTVDVVECLIKIGAEFHNVNGWHFSALHTACKCDVDRLKKVQLITKHFPQLINSKDAFGNTAIFRAANHDSIDVISHLAVNGAHMRVRGVGGLSPVHEAAAFATVSCVDELIKYGAEANSRDDNLRTPLHRAVEWGNIECARSLIETHKVDINTKDKMGETPLHIGSMKGESYAVQFLTEHPQCNVRIKNLMGKMALDYAKERGHQSIEAILHEKITSNDPEKINRDLKLAIRSHMPLLVETVDAEDHLDYLFSKFALNLDELEEVRALHSSKRKMQKMLFFLLDKKNCSWAPIFLQSLKEEETTKQTAELIENTDTSSLGNEIK